MSLPRTSVIDILQAEFKNPEVRAQCHSSVRSWVNRDATTRLFNGFPCLISPELLRHLSNQFLRIFQQIDDLNINGEFKLTNDEDAQKLLLWIKEIIGIGIAELLNKSGTIKSELLDVLDLTAYKDKIDAADLLSAFVGLINEYIVKRSEEQLRLHFNRFSAVCSFVNRNYRTWIIEQLDQSGYVFVSRYEAKKDSFHFRDILQWPEKPIVKTGMIAFIGTVAALAIYSLFNKEKPETPVDAKPSEEIGAKNKM